MHSALIRPSTLKGYSLAVHKYIINPLGDMYMSDVTADDTSWPWCRLQTISSTYNLVNMLFKSIFYSAQYSNMIPDNSDGKDQRERRSPEKGQRGSYGRPGEAPSGYDPGSSAVCLVMIGLYSGLRREKYWACSGTVCSWMSRLPILQYEEPGTLITTAGRNQDLRRLRPSGTFPSSAAG
jgi:hypothetical protein